MRLKLDPNPMQCLTAPICLIVLFYIDSLRPEVFFYIKDHEEKNAFIKGISR